MAGYIGSKASVVSSGAERKKVFNITTSTTALTGLSYTANQVHVFHNGVRLISGTDYTETNDTTITLTNAAENGDQVVVVSYASFQTSDTVSASAGGTFSGAVDVNADGATVLTVDRATSDGTIVDLQKDGTSVGSIGSRAGLATNLILYPNSGNGSGITGAVNGIAPIDETGGIVDGDLDLGGASYRFKDLYLSGGVYLGGTGSANKLDDYEQGNWTPTVVSGTLTNLSQATYTKIGNVVHCQMKVNNFSDTTSSAVVEINLPFAAFSADRSVIATSVLSANVSGLNDMNCYMDAGNVIRFYSSVTGGAYDSLLHSDLNSASTMYVGFSYFSS